jgi:hypothetical protein
MNLDCLIIETTRRCNMRCGHCLRGEPENKSMSLVHLYDFLSQMSRGYISSVTFTGGEPTLPSGMKVIRKFMEGCNRFSIDVGNFYMVTNAKMWRPELPELIQTLYNFCSDNEISAIDISTDQYHDHIQHTRLAFKNRLEDELSYLIGCDYHIVGLRRDLPYESIMEEGRGAQYGSGRHEVAPIIQIETWSGVPTVTEGDIYLNCEGNVISGCDWSYESQRDPENIICKASKNFEEAVFNFADAECETA